MPHAYGKYAVVAITKRWRLFLTPLFLFNQFISEISGQKTSIKDVKHEPSSARTFGDKGPCP